MKIINRFNLTAIFVALLYLLYSYFVLTPDTFKYFSLIDDGQTISNNADIESCFTSGQCDAAKKVFIEKEFGRFRPIYWTINYFIYKSTGLEPILLHQIRIYVIGLIIVLLQVKILQKIKIDSFSIIMSSIFVFTAFTFTENIVRLGPTEPFQLIAIGMLSYFLFNSKKYKWLLIIILYIFSVLIKETSVVILLPILIHSYYFGESKNDKKMSFILLGSGIALFLASRYLSSPDISSIAYSDNFKLDFSLMYLNFRQYLNLFLNISSPFPKILIILFFISYAINQKSKLSNGSLVYWFTVFIVFTGILIPWKHVLERYMLISIFSFSIILAISLNYFSNLIQVAISKIETKRLKIYSSLSALIVYVIVVNMLALNFPLNYAKTVNYRDWYSKFLSFEYDQVKALVDTNAETVYINAVDNLDNWEVLFELPIHLKYIHKSGTQIQRLSDLPESGYIFVRTPFEPSFDEKKIVQNGFSVINQEKYEVSQIDALKFRETFKYRPLRVLDDPKLLTDTFKYSWSIYYKNKK